MSALNSSPDEAAPAPCATFPNLFAGRQGELARGREIRERKAVQLCLTGAGGRRCPLFAWCAANTDPNDKWTVRAAKTPTDRGHARSKAERESERPTRTWPICGTGWNAIYRHYSTATTVCVACIGFRAEAIAARKAAKEAAA